MKSRKLQNKLLRALKVKLGLTFILFALFFTNPCAGQEADIVIQTGHSGYITGLAMTSDAGRIVSSDLTGAVKVFDVHANKEIYQYRSEGGLCQALALDNNEKIAAFDNGYSIKLIDIYSGKIESKFFTGVLNGELTSISFSPAKNYLAVSTKKSLQVYKNGYSSASLLLKSTDTYVKIKWVTDSTLIASHASGNNEILNANTGQTIKQINTTSEVIAIDQYFDGFALICNNGETFRLEAQGTKLIPFTNTKLKLHSAKMMFESNYMLFGKTGKLEVIDLRSNEIVDGFYFNQHDSITRIQTDKKRQYICVGTSYGDVFIWDTKDQRIVSGHEYGIYRQLLTLSVHPSGTKLLIGGMVHGGKLIDLEGRVSVKTVGYDYRMLSSAFNPVNTSEFSWGGYFGASFFYDMNDQKPHQRVLHELKEKNSVIGNYFKSDGAEFIALSDHIQIHNFKDDTALAYNRPFINGGVFNEFSDYNEASNKLIFGNYQGGTALFDTKKRKTVMDKIPGMDKSTDASFTKDGKVLYAIVNDRVSKWNTKDWKKAKEVFNPKPPVKCKYLTKSKMVIVGYPNGDMEFFDENLLSGGSVKAHKSRIIDIKEIPNSDRFVTIDFNGEIKIWSQTTKKWIVGIITGRWGGDMIVYTPDNYYMSTGDGLNFLAFRNGKEVFQPEQFDLIYNRPDIVLSRIGHTSQDMITAFNHAYKRRLSKMGVEISDKNSKWHAPSIRFIDRDKIPVKTIDATREFKVTFSDSLFNLKKLDIILNGVPIYGVKGVELKNNTDTYSFDLEFTDGVNKVQASVTNENGIESIKETVYIYYEPEKVERSLYVLNIGANEYQQSNFNLKYAAKDAEDLNELFSADTNFKEVYTKTITGKEFTKDRLIEIKRFFMNAKRNDVVICTIAGHGVLDDDLDYYFSTYDMDFGNPKDRGISFQDLESVVDGLAAIRKLIIIDACHSGEIDKEDIKIEQAYNITSGKVTFRAVGDKITTHKAVGLKSIGELSRELFSDLRTGTGSIIISSAGGAEYAMEGDQWQNGVFTYSMLEGIKGGLADKNKDGRITVSEILSYSSIRVDELTNGKQKPDYRSINKEFNFYIW